MADKLNLLLFDVDGVLIKPVGYERALIDTLDRFTDFLGIEKTNLTHDEIAFFESRGITNEWLSGAITVSEYIRLLSGSYPGTIAANLQMTLRNAKDQKISLPRPNFIEVMGRALNNAGPEINETPTSISDNIKMLTPEYAHHLVDEILSDVRPPAPFSSLFQNHTLGSDAYEKTYGHKAPFPLPAYLATMDENNLNQNTLIMLEEFCLNDGNSMAIYTARPSLPPADLTDQERAALNAWEFPPEGDMVKDLVGLPDWMPLISGGRMSWLAIHDGLHPGDYIKPSPVHGLSTIAAAYLRKEKNALISASALWNEGQIDQVFSHLMKMDLNITVFEDSPVGLYAMIKAVDFLKERGASIHLNKIGIAQATEKKARLNEMADSVFDDVNEAVMSVVSCD